MLMAFLAVSFGLDSKSNRAWSHLSFVLVLICFLNSKPSKEPLLLLPLLLLLFVEDVEA